MRRSVLLAAAAFVGSTLAGAPAAAQFVQPTAVDPNGPVERLGTALRVLASNPRDLEALMGAGAAALDVGDANAALGFFSRAEEISPSNARAKAGLGAALANIEKPEDALRLFAQAASLGAPDTAFVRDRGLAHDLVGDWRRAQRDYQTALRGNPRDDETVRRYALSLGISGNRAEALLVLDPLLRRQDQGAWRARAFIYAMTGDVGQANTVARQLMPAPMAASMSPLLSRLATLNAAERAHAVNFGTVPSEGVRLATADTSRALPPPALGGRGQPFVLQRAPTLAETVAGRSPSSGLIPSGEPLGRRAGTSTPPVERPVQLAVRPQATSPSLPAASVPATIVSATRTTARREVVGLGDPFAAASVGRRVGARIGPVDPARLPPELRGEATTATLVPTTVLPAPIEPVLPGRVDAGLIGPPADAAPTTTASTSEQVPPVSSPGFTQPAVPAPTAGAAPPMAEPTPLVTPAPRPARLAGLLDGLATEVEPNVVELPSVRELRLAQASARRGLAEQGAAAQAKAESERLARAAAAKVAEDERRHPARLWVQVAAGANRTGLPLTWRRIRDANAPTLDDMTAYSLPFKATNRLLVGPVKSSAEARGIIRALSRKGVAATTFSSDAGQEVVRVGGK